MVLVLLAGALPLVAAGLHEAAAAGDLEKARALLKDAPALVNERYLGSTPLHEAARNGQLEMVKLLVASGAEVNNRNSSGLTPLKLALGYGRKEVVEWLRAHGGLETVPVTAEVKTNVTVAPAPPAPPLAPAQPAAPVVAPRPAPVEVNPPTFPPTVSPAPATNASATASAPRPVPPPRAGAAALPTLNPVIFPIHQAAEVGECEQVKALLKAWPELIEAENEKGLTPLHVAAANARREVVEALLARRANVLARTKYAWEPLHFAVTRGDGPTVALLLAYGARVNDKTRTDETALHMAARGGFADVAKALLERKADPDAVENTTGSTPLHLAVVRDSQALVSLLLAAGANVNKPDASGDAPLTLAVSSGHDAVAALLRQQGGREAESKPLSPLEQSLVDYYGRLDQVFRDGKTSDKRKAALSMVPTHADVQKLFPKNAAQGNKVVDDLLREIKATADKDIGLAANEGDIWKLQPGPSSPYVQYCQSRGLIAPDVPIYTLTVKKKGRKSLMDMFCFVNNHWVPLPPLARILAE
jgi:ankyrin repeat protein